MSPATDLDDAPTVIAPGDPLPDGTRLRDYEITGLLHEGGFAIVYLAWDHSLQRKVAIKEYMPASMASRVDGSSAVAVRAGHPAATFAAGLVRFVEEARLLARFDHPSLVKVYRFWQENDTAYMVMPFYEGPSLAAALAGLGRVPTEAELRTWLAPVLNALTVLHDAGTWHQNIGADDILLTPKGPVLLGLSAAGRAIEAIRRVPAAALKRGFAAIEQYGTSTAPASSGSSPDTGTGRLGVGPWTDLYALAAVIYAAITGAPPAPAPERSTDDTVQPLAAVAAGLYSTGFLAAIDAAMAVEPKQRPADHRQFRALMGDIEALDKPVSLAPRLDLMQEPFLGTVSSHREITVPDRPFLLPAAPAAAPNPAPRPNTAAASLAAAGATSTAGAERQSPSWMASQGLGRRDRRAWYGTVAAICIGLGVLAAVLNSYSRRGAREALAVTLASSSPERAKGPASSLPATPASPPVASAVPVPADPAAAGSGMAPTPPGVVPARLAMPAAPPSAVARPVAAATAGSTASAVAATGAVAVAPSAPPGLQAAERQGRCLEILQKASLERISAADTEFFKKECR